jgi:Adenylosuccinate lyase
MNNKKHGNIPATAVAKYELALLQALLEIKYIPVSRFVMSSSRTDSVRFTALEHVYLESKSDSMEMVKILSARLGEMERRKLVVIDYDTPLPGYSYKTHRDSDVFRYFDDTVKEGSKRPGFLCDTAEIEYGRVAISPLGLIIARKFTTPRG